MKKLSQFKKSFINNFDHYKIVSIFISLFCIIVLITLEQTTKFLVRENLEEGQTLNIINNILDFNLLYNKGAGYSLFSNNYSLLVFFTIIGLLFVFSLLYFISFKNKKVFTIASILIISGAFSNAIDRFFLKEGVTDFIVFPFLNEYSFGNFSANVADVYISIGFVLMLIDILILSFLRNKKKKQIDKKEEKLDETTNNS